MIGSLYVHVPLYFNINVNETRGHVHLVACFTRNNIIEGRKRMAIINKLYSSLYIKGLNNRFNMIYSM